MDEIPSLRKKLFLPRVDVKGEGMKPSRGRAVAWTEPGGARPGGRRPLAVPGAVPGAATSASGRGPPAAVRRPRRAPPRACPGLAGPVVPTAAAIREGPLPALRHARRGNAALTPHRSRLLILRCAQVDQFEQPSAVPEWVGRGGIRSLACRRRNIRLLILGRV
jgi:hypothetical protein